jgi:hypothetical protein
MGGLTAHRLRQAVEGWVQLRKSQPWKPQNPRMLAPFIPSSPKGRPGVVNVSYKVETCDELENVKNTEECEMIGKYDHRVSKRSPQTLQPPNPSTLEP